TVVNVPVTHPPQRNLQRMVAGFLAPDIERAVYPQRLAEVLRALDYRIDVDATLAQDGDLQAFLEDAYETLDARFEVFAHFIDLDDWDLFVGVFMTPDRVNHFLYGDYLDDGPFREDFLAFYEQLDTYVGAIRSRLAEDVTLVIVSDHGFDRLEHEVQVNHWLEERGWLDYDDTEPTDLVDVSGRTRAYSLAPGRFYLNLEDREPRGRVPETEYEPVRDALADELLDWTGPEGRPVIDRVVRRESVYRGPHLDLAPDLVAIPASGFDLKAAFEHGRPQFTPTTRTGMHRVGDAALLIDDPTVELEEASIYDVTPTILRLLGLEGDRGAFDGVSLV
ncbi:MAG: alkaline phosphatase family protein, partial [Halobacteriota archaeon]